MRLRTTRLHPADYHEMPWRNGGGSTTEVAIEPAGATLQSSEPFLWRLSMARVEQDGPFSPFAGYDRTLVLLSGAGAHLDFGPAAAPATLAAPLATVAFAGEWATTCRLLAGPVHDFNVMVDRKRGTAQVEALTLPAGSHASVLLRGHTGLLFVVHGAITAQLGDAPPGKPVATLETERFDRNVKGPPTAVTLHAPDGPAQLVWIDIELKAPRG